MLSDFVTAHREEILLRCRARVAARMAPRPTQRELDDGIPLFLDQLAGSLQSKLSPTKVTPTHAMVDSASKHGADLLSMGFTVAQVVNDYGDACQSITQLAIEKNATITTQEFQALNLCLDEAIAGAVTEYQVQRELGAATAQSDEATESLGVLAHELRNLLGTAMLAFDALQSGSVGIGGSTGAVLGRSLTSLRALVDRSLAVVRLNAGIGAPERVGVAALLEEIEIAAMLEAKVRGNLLTVDRGNPDAVVQADHQILASILANLLQNAFKYNRLHSHVFLRAGCTDSLVTIQIEDECGGLAPGQADSLFKPFQRGSDGTGLGLGLAICRRGIEAIGGSIEVRDMPGKGCVFTVELPRAPNVC